MAMTFSSCGEYSNHKLGTLFNGTSFACDLVIGESWFNNIFG